MEVYGVATMSYIEDEAWCLNEIPETLDWVMTFLRKARLNAEKTHVVDGKWLKLVMNKQLETSFAQVDINARSHCSIIKSSGTTGKIK